MSAVTGAEGLRGLRACVFDAYGTLFDFASAAAALRRRARRRGPTPRGAVARQAAAIHVAARAAGPPRRFLAGDRRRARFRARDARPLRAGLRERLMQLYLTLDAYPEVAGRAAPVARRRDRRPRSCRTARPAMLAAAVDACRARRALFDHVLSVEAGRRLQAAPARLPARLRPARPRRRGDRLRVVERLGRLGRLGLRHAGRLVQPSGQPRERLPGAPDREIRSLAELPARFAV